MSPEELGKINKPKADHAQKSRKIYFVPLIINYFPDIEEFGSLLTEYWISCDNQINKLESQAGTISKIFHEGVWSDGKEALTQIGSLNKFCLDLINSRINTGSTLLPIESEENYKKLMDLTRIVQLGFASEQIRDLISNEYNQVVEERNKFVTNQIEKIGDTEAGLLIGSTQNFNIPEEIELFNIMPPEHDKILRWLSEKEKSLRSQDSSQNHQENVQEEDSSSKESGLWTP
ncbi:MAG: hypothetical protein CL764_06635 [Chloroflexi bacterium]|nr:hypothetical protein [Chloroflexota bacterium]|tara:strand:- start:472 stop:1167 length:696 start_codon:yes stop_codon:yes gene_type:complete